MNTNKDQLDFENRISANSIELAKELEVAKVRQEHNSQNIERLFSLFEKTSTQLGKTSETVGTIAGSLDVLKKFVWAMIVVIIIQGFTGIYKTWGEPKKIEKPTKEVQSSTFL